jgi:WD40 repeat protein
MSFLSFLLFALFLDPNRCMDGSVQLVRYGRGVGGVEGRMGAQALVVSSTNNAIKHGKYVRCMEWAPSSPILASAAADGTVYLNKIKSMDEDTGIVEMETVQTLHLSGAVESLCFLDDHTLCAYVRGTPHLSYFDLNDGCKPSKLCINSGGSSGGFEDHVSFTIMDMSPSPIGGGKFLAAATDNSRNIIFDSRTAKHVRNLYGK